MESPKEALEKQVELIFKRLDKIEKKLAAVIALPHLTNVAGRNAVVVIAQINAMIQETKDELAKPDITDVERDALNEKLVRYEYYISPSVV